MSNIKKLYLLLFFGLIFRILISFSIYSGDVNNHTQWGKGILSDGFKGAYEREYPGVMKPTYPPLALYGFTTSTGLYQISNELVLSLNKNIDFFPSGLVWIMEDQDVLPAFNKVFSIIADIGTGLLIYRLVQYFKKDRNVSLVAAGIYLFNPVIWYLSSLWGQIESFPLFFLMLSVWYMIKKSLIGHVFFIFAILSKQSMIIYIPFFFLQSIRKIGISKTIYGGLMQLIIFYLMYLPFSNSSDFFWPISVYIDRIQTGSGSVWISDHAFNLWALYSNLEKIPDSTIVGFGLSAKLIGYFVFLLFTLVVSIKFLLSRSQRIIIYLYALLPMLSFLLLTKMHERYYAPVIPFLTIAAALDPILWPIYIAVSFAHWINIYHEWYFPRISPIDEWIMQQNTINMVIAIFTISGVFLLIRYLKINNENK